MDILQQLDQMQAFLGDYSGTLYSYYTDLKKRGFTEKQAFKLVQGLQELQMKGDAK